MMIAPGAAPRPIAIRCTMQARIQIVVAGGSMWESTFVLKDLPTKSPTSEAITANRVPKSTPAVGPHAVTPTTDA